MEVWDVEKVGPGTIGIKIRGRAWKLVPTYNHNLSKVKLAAPHLTRLASVCKIRRTRPPLGTEVVIPCPIQSRGKTVIKVSTPVLTGLAASACPRVGSLLQNINSLCLAASL